MFRHARTDLPASVVVFLVALPLCLGIAHACEVPLLSGLVAGVLGGVVVGALSGSTSAVSGPAAGLVVVVLDATTALGSFAAVAATVAAAGVLQVAMGLLRLGAVRHFVPVSVIRGMLAAIGAILVLKQLPYAVGLRDGGAGLSLRGPEGAWSLSTLREVPAHLSGTAAAIAALSLLLLWIASRPAWRQRPRLRLVPGALLSVAAGTGLHALLARLWPSSRLLPDQLVTLPDLDGPAGWLTHLPAPDLAVLTTSAGWTVAATLAAVASLETLLSVEAGDRIDPFGNLTPTNRELMAQGAGNVASGLLGGLPITAVIVRTSANLDAGARTRLSTIAHGAWLFLSVTAASTALAQIPLASLAAVLIAVGAKLCPPALWRQEFRQGASQLVPFATTFFAILATDLLSGVLIGLAVSAAFVLAASYRRGVVRERDGAQVVIRLSELATFLHKAALRDALAEVQDGDRLIVDLTAARYLDQDIVETLEEFERGATARNVTVELRRRAAAPGDAQ